MICSLADGRVVAPPWSLVKAAVACLVLTGCFYIDPINRLPVVDSISCRFLNDDRPCSSLTPLHRTDKVELSVAILDPDDSAAHATHAWSAFVCNTLDTSECETSAYTTSTAATPLLEWPRAAEGVRALLVAVDVRDGRGARVRQSARFTVNDPPTLELRASPGDRTLRAPMQLTATYDDVDEGPSNIQLAWEVTGPTADAEVLLEDIDPGPPAPPVLAVRKRFVPTAVGRWDVKVTATDGRAETVEEHLTLDVGPDLPPCIARVQPAVPPAGAVLPVLEPTVFQVPRVTDDLDVYPPTFSDPAFGAATFAWSILAPGATTRQVLLDATGNSIDFDPAAFTPGQRVEIRVEVFDRTYHDVSCADALPTCVVAARPQCTQRQTWRVEIR